MRVPRLIHWILRRILRKDLLDTIYGDLLEDYYLRRQKSPWRANLSLLMEGIAFVRFPILLSKYQNHTTMSTWTSHFKFSIRNLRKHRANAAISIAGLIVSFSVSLIILQYVRYERSYDSFHEKDIYRATHIMESASGVSQTAQTFHAVMRTALAQIPEISNGVQLVNAGTINVTLGDSTYQQPQTLFASPELFDVFDYTMTKGRFSDDPGAMAISASVANRWFDERNPIGEVVELSGFWGQDRPMKISGVFEDLPSNSHMRAAAILPQEMLLNMVEEQQLFGPNLTLSQVGWLWLGFDTYFTVHEGAHVPAIEEQVNQIVALNRKERNAQVDQDHRIQLQAIEAIHVTTGVQNEMSPANDGSILDLFLIVGVLILLIGWINYINLSTGRAVIRAKEVGVRKVMGSSAGQLKQQFQMEAFLLNFIALCCAFLLAFLVGPFIEQLVEVSFFEGTLYEYRFLMAALLIVAVGSLVSGYYPARILARFKPIDTLKGRVTNTSHGILLRRILVGFQFTFTLFLMTGLLVIQRQMIFMMDHDLGMNIQSTVIVNSPALPPSVELTNEVNTYKNELLKLPGIEVVATSSMAPGIPINWRISTQDSNPDRSGVFVQRSLVDYDFFDLYEIPLLAGRVFEQQYGSESNNLVVNLNAVDQLGFDSPEEALGYDLTTINQSYKIVGVVDNFHQRGLQVAIEPIMFGLDTASTGNYITIRMNANAPDQTLEEVNALYLKMFPEQQFVSQNVVEVFASQYEAEQRFRMLFGLFTIVAFIIAIMGLLGLASFLLNQRLKEVCIRKVLGARKQTLFYLLNKEHIIICMLSFVMSGPLAYYFLNEWLNDFELRIGLHWLYFIVPLVLIVALILVSTSLQTVKVINYNPSRILRDE